MPSALTKVGQLCGEHCWPAGLLRHHDFRLVLSGQSISLIGTWMTRTAVSWLVFRLTGSAWLLGIVGFSGQVPSLLLSPITGVLADRWGRRYTLIVTQILSMLQVCALAALAFSHVIAVWHIILLGVLRGILNAFEAPARETFVLDMVDRREAIGEATAFNSTLINIARLIGPPLAGMVIVSFGEGYCFLIDGVSYVPAIVCLCLVTGRTVRHKPRFGLVREVVEDWKYASQSPAIRSILALLTLMSLAGMPYTVLMPIVAGSVLHGGPHALGFLLGASGIGALAGAICLRGNCCHEPGKVISAASVTFGGGVILFSMSRYIWPALGLMSITSFALMQHLGASNIALKLIAAEDKRGRVMSYFSMCFLGMTPFGTLLLGACAQHFGASQTLFCCGLICLGGGLLFASLSPLGYPAIDSPLPRPIPERGTRGRYASQPEGY